MILGVVAKPIPSRDFDGKLFMKRVLRTESYRQSASNQNFTDDASVNGLIKNGEWLELVTEGMSLSKLRDAVGETYQLKLNITERLVLRYYIPLSEEGGKTKVKHILKDDASLLTMDLFRLIKYQLMVRYEKGDEREINVTCNSEFMVDTMPEVGQSIRDAYHWVPSSSPIFLYMDNAGGHGRKEVVNDYVKMLREKYNVICVHQRPRSPESNMLDLGVWMAMQNVVEKLHFRQRVEVQALFRTCEKAWKKLEPIKLQNVYNRWKMVLDLIIDDEGGNFLVETKRGKLFRAPSDTAEEFAKPTCGGYRRQR